MTATLLAVLAGAGTALLAVPAHRPRRFAEDGAHGVRTDRVSDRPSVDAPTPASKRHAEASDLADCCDLLAVAAASGCTVIGSVAAVGSVASGPVAEALQRAALEVGSGQRFADALPAVIDQLGPAVRPLVTTLLSASSSGAPVAPAMLRLADAERRRRRRQVEARVRRLPVLLLLPLVGFVLPAFVVLTLVPAGISATRGTGLTGTGNTPSSKSVPSFPRTSIGSASRSAAPARPTGGRP